MEFIGDDGIPAKLLKDWVSSITKISKWISYYVEVIKHMRTMYQVCKLVHGDLSEFNILLHKGFVQIKVRRTRTRAREHELVFESVAEADSDTRFPDNILNETKAFYISLMFHNLLSMIIRLRWIF